jgi:RNA polymerase sigma factor (sigma-70 family)
MLNRAEMPQDRTAELERVYSGYVRKTDFWSVQFRISGEDFQDCLQEAWIKADRRLSDYDPAKAQLRTWFHPILCNQITDWRRKRSSERKGHLALEGDASRLSEPTNDDAAPPWASGEYHLIREECHAAVNELLRETENLLRQYAPTHKPVFEGLINDVALTEIANRLGRNDQSVGASVRRKRQQFVAALKSDTAFGERVRRIKALAAEISELRHMLDQSRTPLQMPKTTESSPGEDE